MDLTALLKAILQPHEHVEPGVTSRFTVCGPHIAFWRAQSQRLSPCISRAGDKRRQIRRFESRNRNDRRRLGRDGENLVFHWLERGGPYVCEKPDTSGFGSKLLRDTITRLFGGTIDKHWNRDGLYATIVMPFAGVAK
jgi:hypothetical protein